jgi:hypothetical protein
MIRIKPLTKLINILLADGYKPDFEGNWKLENCVTMTNNMLLYAGNIFDKDEFENIKWEEKWLESIVEYPCLMKDNSTGLIVHVNINETAIVIEEGLPVYKHKLGQVFKMVDMDDEEGELIKIDKMKILYLNDFELFAEIKKIS